MDRFLLPSFKQLHHFARPSTSAFQRGGKRFAHQSFKTSGSFVSTSFGQLKSHQKSLLAKIRIESNGSNGQHTSSDSKQLLWILKALGLGAALTIGAAASQIEVTAEDTEAKDGKAKEEEESLRAELKKNNQSGKAPIYRVVLTGGPCGGKSTALSLISDRLRSLGFRVFVVPEAATIVITGGGIWKDYRDMTPDQALAFEGSLMKTKMALEEAFHAIAEASNEPAVIVCDRGTMDTAAYLPKSAWEVLLDEYGWNEMNLRDRRYDAVIHMVTAAIGAERFYTTENNTARTETLDEARALDFKILNAWVGHPVIKIIDNSTDFQEKVQKVITNVCQVVGAPKPIDYKRKFVIANMDDIHIPVKYEQFEVEQTYLLRAKEVETNGFTFIRRRGQNGSYHYSYSMLRDVHKQDKEEKTVLERQISGREYIALLKQADPTRVTVKKEVKCFVYNNQYFQLSKFVEPRLDLTILETEATKHQEQVFLPEWLKAPPEVTDDLRFSSFKIAKLERGTAEFSQAAEEYRKKNANK